MSRTSIKERNKAIRLAWEKEQQLVQEGKGTRNWTKEQQKDILNPDKGKAYDDKGRAFEGQHMKSAAEHPEYQGDPDNIQFLTREEHLEAHKGSWQTPTNWYYNPETKEFIVFGENKYVPCTIIDLTDSIVRANEAMQVLPETAGASPEEKIEKDSGEAQQKDSSIPKKPSTSASSAVKPSPTASKSFGERIMDVAETVKGFGERHPVLTGVLTAFGAFAVAAGTEAIANSGKGSGGGSRSSSTDDYFGSSSGDDYADSLDSGDDDYDDSSSGRNYPDDRSSPEKHTVSPHWQRYHTKDGVVRKEKKAYPRGGKHDDD